MANSIAVVVYKVSFNPVTSLDYVSISYPYSQKVETIQGLYPVNVTGGQDLPGLGYLYCKVVLKQPGLEQEYFVMNNVQDIQNKMNS